MRVAVCAYTRHLEDAHELGEGSPIGPDEIATLYERRHGRLDEHAPLVARYLFGDPHTRGLLGSYLAQGNQVWLLSPGCLERRLTEMPGVVEALDCNLAYLELEEVKCLLTAGVAVIGYRNLTVDRKFAAAGLMAEALRGSSHAAVPVQAFLPAGLAHDDACINAVERSIESDFLICKGNWSTQSREGNFKHLVVARGHLHAALVTHTPPRSGVVVSELILSGEPTNNLFHKVHLLPIDEDGPHGPVYRPLGIQHYEVRNRIDLAEVARRGYAPLDEVTHCLADRWLPAHADALPGLADLCAGIALLDPLGSLCALDVITGRDGVTYFLEANHFASTYLDRQFTGDAPIDRVASLLHAKISHVERQRRWIERLAESLSHLACLDRPARIDRYGHTLPLPGSDL